MKYEYFYESLRYHLEKAGRGAQAAVCRHTNIPRSYLSRIVNGERRAGPKTQLKIAAFFNIEPTDFREIGRRICLGEDPGTAMDLLQRMSEDQLLDRLVSAMRKEMATARILDRTQLMYESIVENSRHLILRFDARLQITFANPAAISLLNLNRRDIRGLNLFDLLKTRYHRQLRDQFGKISEYGGTFSMEVETAKDRCWLSVDITVLKQKTEMDLGQLVGVDITEQKQLMDRLFFIQHGVEKSYVPTLWIAEDARIAYVNEAVSTLLGYTRKELLQLHVWDINPLIPKSIWQEKWTWFQTHGKVIFAGQYRKKDGTIIPVEFQVSNLKYPDGRHYNVVFVKTDLT